jgi:hypothetical protein
MLSSSVSQTDGVSDDTPLSSFEFNDPAPRPLRYRHSRAVLSADSELDYITDGSELAEAFVSAHNHLRAKHLDTPPVSWDNQLARAANYFAVKCTGIHDYTRGFNVGESNYIFGSDKPFSAGTYFTARAATAWYSEVKSWDFDQSRPVATGHAEHFTQVVWKGTTKIGCALAQCPGLLRANSILIICRYAPQGNSGSWEDNVMPLIAPQTAPDAS